MSQIAREQLRIYLGTRLGRACLEAATQYSIESGKPATEILAEIDTRQAFRDLGIAGAVVSQKIKTRLGSDSGRGPRNTLH